MPAQSPCQSAESQKSNVSDRKTAGDDYEIYAASPWLKTNFSKTRAVALSFPSPFPSSPGIASERVHRSDCKRLSDSHTAPRAGCMKPQPLWFLSPVFLIFFTKGCISLLRFPIGQFWFIYLFSQSNLCVKWQHMNQVTEKRGRLDHFSSPGRAS